MTVYDVSYTLHSFIAAVAAEQKSPPVSAARHTLDRNEHPKAIADIDF
jgi:hypothetical protein